MRCHPALRLSLLLIPLLLILSSSTCLAGVVYVKWDSPNDGPGNDWDHAYHSVQAGLNAALAGDEVWVAGDSAHPYVERITLKDGVGLYGGFAGAETSRDQRDWTTNETILDGNQAGSTVAAYFGTTSSTIIDGFTIRNGKGSILGTQGERYGGGIFCNFASPIIRNNTVTGNSATHGAGIYCSAFPAVITQNVITGNVAASTGGGIGCSLSALLIEGNTIAGNAASSQGAGIHCYRSSPVIQGNTITGNLPSSDSAIVGGGIYCAFPSSPTITGNTVADNSASSGGGIYFEKNCSPNITNNTIARNMATQHNGGGICCLSSASITNNTVRENTARGDGGGFYCATTSSVTISGNAIIGNETYQGNGGGIFSDESSPTIENNAIIANRASRYGEGGGIFGTGGSPAVVNNKLVGNSADTGAGIYCYGSSMHIRNNMVIANDAEYGGGIVCSWYPYPSITNNTIVGNSSRGGFGPGGIAFGVSAPVIANNIIAFNSSGICGSPYTGALLTHNCVYGNGAYDYYHVTPGQGDFSEDPKLACLARGDCHIQPDSPCLDAGDNSVIQPGWTDIDGQDRIQPTGGTVDIGVDESDGTWWSEEPQTIVRVSPDGNDANDGSSWVSAKRTVQAGIDAASVLGGDVWVRAGTYLESIGLRPHVHVFGGFSGLETERAKRDWHENVTILEGMGEAVVTASVGAHVSSTIDGFTIRNGELPAGSGVKCLYASPVIANNDIVGNAIAIRCYDSCPTIVNNRISGNSSGGIYCEDSSPTVAFNLIDNNTGGYSGGGICCHLPYTPHRSPVITGNIITGNSAVRRGGAVYCGGSPTIAGNVISENVVSDGDGGAIYCGAATISNNMITRNSSSHHGGGIYCRSSFSTITNNTIVGNSAPEGGGICSNYRSPTITNTIVAFNSSGVYNAGTGSPRLTYNCVYGNTAYDFSGMPDPTGTNGNISEDPLFLDPAYGDYHLRGPSPCIDAGDDSAVEPDWLDIDGEPRIQLLHVDMGADEYAPIPVQIDVLPGESANVIRLQPNRMITVAVLSNLSFDARNIDPLSVVFGPELAAEVHKRGHWEDVNQDGLIDLVLHFRCGDTGIQPGETSVNLYGRLLNGEIIAGSDTITAISK